MNRPGPHVNVRLAIAVGSDPIEGKVAVGDTEPRDFQTWFELIAALDAARHENEGDER